MRKIEDILLKDDELFHMLKNNQEDKAARFLFNQQLQSRSDINRRYTELSNLNYKKLQYDGFSINLQFNPARKISTGAVVDDKSINERECFLCFNNIPAEQKSVQLNDFLLLVNPYPVFPEHFTIVNKEHFPQNIKSSFNDLLLLSKKLSPYVTLFYNGPECGASAPDHLHFQGGTKGYMPIENEINFLEKKFGRIIKPGAASLISIDDSLRKIILIKGNEPEEINNLFFKFYEVYEKYFPDKKEPLMNIISVYDPEIYKIIIFLREKHRPAAFFDQEENNFFVSPAAADLGGIFITPLKKDFEKGGPDFIKNIFNEVSLDEKKFLNLKNELVNIF
jgi:galactose-1-phosphate uridylyltransferase